MRNGEWPGISGILTLRIKNGSPVDSFSVRPQSFQIVQITSFGQKRVQDDVTPVLQDPRALFVTFGSERFISASFHLDSHFISQRMHLTNIRAGRDDEKIHNRRHAGQIEYNGIFTAVLLAKFCNMAGIFQAALQPRLRGGIGDGGGNGDAPEGNLRTRIVVRDAV